jgi:transcriptional regulator GlxA family with amidase domain
LLRSLSDVFVVSPPGGPTAAWVEASVRYALEASAGAPSSDPLATRLPELLLVEVLRLHLASQAPMPRGWMAALADPVLGPAITRLHEDPARRWTVHDLARAVATSRSVLDERFRQVLGQSPMRYLATWRMRLATHLLRTTQLGVGAVASRVGYDSEEAFSRAFRRHLGEAPARWRQEELDRR